MHKVREAMKSSESQKMDGKVQVDEFTIEGKEEGKQGRSYDTKKKKVLCAIQLSNQGKVKRFYAFKIPDYSSKSLRTIFDKHIDKTAYLLGGDVATDVVLQAPEQVDGRVGVDQKIGRAHV